MKASKDPMIRAGLMGVIVGVVGCADAPRSTEAPPASQSAPRVATWLNSPDVQTVQSVLGDASSRLTRSIKEEQSRRRLGDFVDSLSRSIDIGDVNGAERFLALARGELDGGAGETMASRDKALFEAALDRALSLISPVKQ